jgi:hypothetical protein
MGKKLHAFRAFCSRFDMATLKCQQSLVFIQIILQNSYVYSQKIQEYPKPSIRIVDIQNKNNAPFKNLVKGTALKSENYYIYLVVVDNDVEWIQPKCKIYNGDSKRNFEGNCHLGEIYNPASLNKWYTIFAIVTDKKYKQYEHPEEKTIIAKSNEIRLYRSR